TSKRMETDNVARSKYDATADKDRVIVERLAQIAADRGVSRVEIALAWLLQKEPVVAPIIGATKLEHLEKPVEAISVKLTDAEVAFLEEPYVPHLIVGHS
ncbi:MAG TPA: aldo/keto reductase, partial [Trichococcus flocculiformis]|nr:aldo/keto reductase [Trichococcus flocculiformis]